MLEKIVEFIKSKIILIIIIIVVIVLFIWIMSLVNNSSSSGSGYEKVISTMEKAARNYYSANPDELPDNGKSVVIKEKELVSSHYMKSINEILDDENASCTGEVSVTNISGEYRYTPKLDCNDKYKTVDLVSKLKEETVVSSGDGLYNLNGTLVYRGEFVNNYVVINENLYRIFKIKNNKVYLVSNFKTESVSWDDRYNTEKSSKVGINDYTVSRLKEKLEEMYASDKLFTSEDRLMISTQTLNIGKRKITDVDSNEESTTLENQYLATLTANDYMNASIDTNCQKVDDVSCINYNYLANSEYNYWLLTADADTTYKVYRFNYGSGVTLANASSSTYIRPTFALTEDTMYVSGSGTEEDPYVIK